MWYHAAVRTSLHKPSVSWAHNSGKPQPYLTVHTIVTSQHKECRVVEKDEDAGKASASRHSPKRWWIRERTRSEAGFTTVHGQTHSPRTEARRGDARKNTKRLPLTDKCPHRLDSGEKASMKDCRGTRTQSTAQHEAKGKPGLKQAAHIKVRETETRHRQGLNQTQNKIESHR